MSISDLPLSTGDNGRKKDGKFGQGNKFGGGNPNHKKACQLRSSLFKAVTQTDLRKIIKSMVKAAADGDVQAARLVFERMLGPAVAIDLDEQWIDPNELLERFETAVRQGIEAELARRDRNRRVGSGGNGNGSGNGNGTHSAE